MNNFDKYILYNIFYFLHNEDIFKITSLNKYYNTICYLSPFKETIKYRKHPVVFNVFDNLCNKCNLKIIFFNDDFKISRCSHYKKPNKKPPPLLYKSRRA